MVIKKFLKARFDCTYWLSKINWSISPKDQSLKFLSLGSFEKLSFCDWKKELRFFLLNPHENQPKFLGYQGWVKILMIKYRGFQSKITQPKHFWPQCTNLPNKPKKVKMISVFIVWIFNNIWTLKRKSRSLLYERQSLLWWTVNGKQQ